MMNKTKSLSSAKALAVILAAMLCIASIGMFTGCTTPDREVETPLPSLTPPENLPKVHSVVITYNDVAVENVLSTDISQGTLKIGATVNKDDGASGSLNFTSSNKTVAEIDSDGNITLKAAGETVIAASFGTETASIVLTVEGGVVGKYKITVNGGLSDVSTASVGDIVTLNAVTPEHKEFSQWIYTESETPITWISGNMFKMPDGNVTIRAEYIDKLYTLRLIGGKVTNDGSADVQDGEIIGYDGSNKIEAYAITEYKYAYGTQLSFEAVATPAGKMFVGWDKNTVNNRLEDEEQQISEFEMPDETTTFWANFSNITTREIFTPSNISGWDSSKINGSAADSVFEGFSGFTVSIPGGQAAIAGYPENITGSIIDTTVSPSQSIRAIFRNRGDKDVTIEVFASFYTNLATTGKVTVPAGETVTKTFLVSLGIEKPWWGFAVRENVAAGSTVPLDMVFGCADAYPKGDKTLSVTNGTQFVNLSDWQTKQGWIARGMKLNNSSGWTTMWNYEATEITAPYVLVSELNAGGLPYYDPDDPYITVYIRMLNQAGSDHSYTYRFFLSEEDTPINMNGGSPALDEHGLYTMRTDINVAYGDCTVSNHGQTELLALRIPRAATGGRYWFGIIKMSYSTPDGSKPANEPPYYADNFSIILTYNNGIGFDGDIIDSAEVNA